MTRIHPEEKRTLALGVIGALVVAGLLLVQADSALARTSFRFGLHVGAPAVPYPVYTYPYYPPPVYYAPAPVHRLYPPCARVWVPGYYDAYGNWAFGYYRYDCNFYRW